MGLSGPDMEIGREIFSRDCYWQLFSKISWLTLQCSGGLTYWLGINRDNYCSIQSSHHTRKLFVWTFNFLLDLLSSPASFLQPDDISLGNSRHIPVYSVLGFVLKCLLHIGHKFKRLCWLAFSWLRTISILPREKLLFITVCGYLRSNNCTGMTS